MKKILLIALLTFTASVQAATITITDSGLQGFTDLGQTTLDTNTGLEWLNFSNLNNGTNELMTMGFSINDSLSNFGSFRLAVESEIVNLFATVFPTIGTTGITQFANTTTSSIATSRNNWMSAFGTDVNPANTGTTFTNTGGVTTATVTAGSVSSRGMYIDGNGDVQYAGALINLDDGYSKIYGPSFQTGLPLTEDSAYSNYGVFMVRDGHIPAVPVPAAVWLMMSGLLGLVAVARHKA